MFWLATLFHASPVTIWFYERLSVILSPASILSPYFHHDHHSYQSLQYIFTLTLADPIPNTSMYDHHLNRLVEKTPHLLNQWSHRSSTTWGCIDHRVWKVKNTTECVIGTPYSEGKQTLLRVIIAPTPTKPTIDSAPNPLSPQKIRSTITPNNLGIDSTWISPPNSNHKSNNRKEVNSHGLHTRTITERQCHPAQICMVCGKTHDQIPGDAHRTHGNENGRGETMESL